MPRAGGWGPNFGDEGGGFWIGREAIRVALRSADREEFPEFVSTIERTLELQTISEVVSHWASGRIGHAQIAALAPQVLGQYETAPARSIINEAAAHLRALVETAGMKIGARDFPRSVVGSIGSDPLMRKLIGIEFTAPVDPPERGAIAWSRSLFQ
jgi:N-acetylglucosamine kinase